jgi:hypothetical protein
MCIITFTLLTLCNTQLAVWCQMECACEVTFMAGLRDEAWDRSGRLPHQRAKVSSTALPA